MKKFLSRGFSFPELIIVLAIVIILFGMGTFVFISARKDKQLIVETDKIVFRLEEARTNALAGKNGSNFGIKFSTTTYIYFSGNSYNSADTSNITFNIDMNFQATTSLPSSDNTVIFARLNGVPSVTGTTTISEISNPAHFRRIVIGSEGEITVVK
jgi:prepilin-type N-terminal cleavage/methylation domain-containing protein